MNCIMLMNVLAIVAFHCICISNAEPFPVPNDPDWFNEAKARVKQMVNLKRNENHAKNVIIFLGDGMGMSTITAARIHEGQIRGESGEENTLAMETFPYVSTAKIYTADSQVPDSSATATAILSGQKSVTYTSGMNDKVKQKDCRSVPGNEAISILKWSQDEGKSTGVVSTCKITHASPSAAYAHVASRYWEAVVPPGCEPYVKDIASQLLESDINVALGGGRENFYNEDVEDIEHSDRKGKRNDSRNIVEEWTRRMQDAGYSHDYVWNRDQFNDVDPENTDFLMGLFETGHMNYEAERSDDVGGEPGIVEMVDKAIKILRKNDKGFFLFVEGGRIDNAHHDSLAKLALLETIEMNKAVQRVMDLTNEEETLIVVTADHSHTFTVGGYPGRGNPLFGFQDNDIEVATDGWPYMTLSYANGPYRPGRVDMTGVDTEALRFIIPSLVPLKWETHVADDVIVYAKGPFAHLMEGNFEQNYIAHVMAYASCVGAYADDPDCPHTASAAGKPLSPSLAYMMSLLILLSGLIY